MGRSGVADFDDDDDSENYDLDAKKLATASGNGATTAAGIKRRDATERSAEDRIIDRGAGGGGEYHKWPVPAAHEDSA